jgi:hypothetical protein
MEPKEISGELSHTFNLENFENVKVSAGMIGTVKPGEDVKDAYDALFQEIGEQLFMRLQRAVEALRR